MIIYSVRALNIIEILKNSHDPVSSLALSEEIGCSTKTIQSEIKDINKNGKDGKIISIRGIGYKIEGSFDHITIPSPYLGNVDRIDYIIKNVMFILYTKYKLVFNKICNNIDFCSILC